MDWCRLALWMLFLSDIASANGRHLRRSFLNPPEGDLPAPFYSFPVEYPTAHDWTEWVIFWGWFTEPGLYLTQPLGQWVARSHAPWCWFYDPVTDTIAYNASGLTTLYLPVEGRTCTRSEHVYVCRGHHRGCR